MAKEKLSTDQRMVVLRMHAEGNGFEAIRKEVKEKWSISIQPKALQDTCAAKKWQPYVKAFRDEYLAKVKSVPIANKRIRIDDLERERKRIIGLIERNPRKTKSDITQHLQLVAELRRIMDTAREEMEKKPHLFQNVVVGMGDMSDESLHRRKQELIKRIRRFDGTGTSGADTNPGGTESEG
jgi:seryl-tRNA synthetase